MTRTRRNGAARGGGSGSSGSGRGFGQGTHGRRRGDEATTPVVVDTMAPLEMFRRFLVQVAKHNVAEPYRRRKDVFPCSYGGGGGGGNGGNGDRQLGRRRSHSRILVDADGDDGYVVDAVGQPVVRAGVGLLRVPPGGRVRKIDYTSASGGTSLTWRWDPDHAYRRLGRVSGVATNWSLQYLGVAGVITTEWAVGRAPVMRAKRERAAKSWPAVPDLRTAGFNRRDRREAERRNLESGALLRFPTGYEDDGRKRERDGSEIIQGMPTLDGASGPAQSMPPRTITPPSPAVPAPAPAGTPKPSQGPAAGAARKAIP